MLLAELATTAHASISHGLTACQTALAVVWERGFFLFTIHKFDSDSDLS